MPSARANLPASKLVLQAGLQRFFITVYDKKAFIK
jgi:hypothetical protein